MIFSCTCLYLSIYIVLYVISNSNKAYVCIQFNSTGVSSVITGTVRSRQKGNWRAPWKNRISSTTMKLRKSLVKPVTWQHISSCLVLPPKIVMHDTFNVILWTSADICVIVHDDLWWKNQTTLYNCRFSAASLALRVIFVSRKRLPIYALCMLISGGRTKQLCYASRG